MCLESFRLQRKGQLEVLVRSDWLVGPFDWGRFERRLFSRFDWQPITALLV